MNHEIWKEVLNETRTSSKVLRVGDKFVVANKKTGQWEITINDMYWFDLVDEFVADVSGKHLDTGKSFKSRQIGSNNFKKKFNL